jgi:capping protein beta
MSDQLDCALDLMRRLPPAQIEDNLAGLIDLVPDLTEQLLSAVDQPLKVAHDPVSKRDYLLCDYNRDGDSYRSPWSNQYFPALEDGFLPSSRLRTMEVEANKVFDVYRKLYFETGISSVYCFETDEKSAESFGACFLIHKDVEEKKGGLEKGWWDSIHVFEVNEDPKKGFFNYKLTSTVMVSMVIKDSTVGQVDLSGNMTKQETKRQQMNNANPHLSNLGRMLEEMELRIRNSIEGIYIQKTREVINGMRTTTGQRDDQWGAIADALKQSVLSKSGSKKIE